MDQIWCVVITRPDKSKFVAFGDDNTLAVYWDRKNALKKAKALKEYDLNASVKRCSIDIAKH